MKIAFHFIENVFGSSTKENSACTWFLALYEEGEVVITNLANLE